MRDDVRFGDNPTEPETGSCGADAETADPTLKAVRAIVDQDPAESQPRPGSGRAPARRDGSGRTTSAEQVFPPLHDPGPAPAPERPHWLVSAARRLRGIAWTFLGRSDAPRVLSALLLLVLIVLRPGFVVFLAVIALLFGLVTYFSVGPDRVAEWVTGRYRRLRERDPEAAENIRRRAARASKWLSAVVGKLPESWTAGLYLPDFEEAPEPPERLQADPFDRLAKQ